MLEDYSNSGASRQSDGSFAAQYAARQGAPLPPPKMSAAPKSDTTELTADVGQMRFVHATDNNRGWDAYLASKRKAAAVGTLSAPASPMPAPAAAKPAAATASPEALGTRTAIAFLKKFDPDGWHNLTAIHPTRTYTGKDGKPHAEVRGKTFAPGQWEEMEDWINARQGEWNLYFSVNEPRPRAPDKKLREEDIGAIRALCCDVDPEDGADILDSERVRLRRQVDNLAAGPVPPTFAIDSGSGVQSFWQMREKLDPAVWVQQAKDIGRGIAHALDGDPVQDICRVMRLPGTTNIPNAIKLSKGRVARKSELLFTNPSRYSLADVDSQYPAYAAAAKEDKSGAIAEAERDLDQSLLHAGRYEDLPADLQDRFNDARGHFKKLAKLWDSGEHNGNDDSYSGGRFALAGWLRWLTEKGSVEFDVNDYAQLLWVWDHAVGPHDDREAKLSEREIARAWGNAKPKEHFSPIEDDEAEIAAQDKQLPLDAHADGTPNADKAKATTGRKRFEFMSLDDIERAFLVEPKEPLIDGLLDQGTLSVVYGASNVGKTFICLDMAWAIAQGRQWAGQATRKTGVLYIAAEGGTGVLGRVLALNQIHGRPGAKDFVLLRSKLNFYKSDADAKELLTEARAYGLENIGLIVVDTLARSMDGGDESATKDMSVVVGHLDNLRKATGAHVMLVHHSGKDETKGARGSSALRAATDTEIELRKTDEESATGGTITTTKQRDMDGSFSRAFTLETVKLGGGDHREASSCVARVSAEKAQRGSAPTEPQREVMAAMADMGDPGEAFSVQDIRQALGPSVSDNTVLQRLKRMKTAGFVRKDAQGRWSLRTDCPDKKPENWFESHEAEPENSATTGDKPEAPGSG
ncbi:AAA domain-containing protein [Rhizobium tibeticum]|uniref:AAA domain-containing protein n=1 Tax=Rhizobium tibeticum TaxID=501024 RepID=A0A1H8JT95_9HYPH|nr:AAA family ATPase [Rhizobium tibeticum]SEH79504.1 DNA repair and recombination protein RadB [Rhizobium tibeticum]SEN83929.1 AAA domain-containing protein [Rhizobium tibeticum]